VNFIKHDAFNEKDRKQKRRLNANIKKLKDLTSNALKSGLNILKSQTASWF
ncbi:hypothetical protein VCHENC02_3221, partial [Vibrio harveyi]